MSLAPNEATRAQIDAADPSGSVWLAANAGSGKTRVLTQRVAWLLLEGTAPERILCLTYTKAAAGEMQNRLFGLLGGWAMLEDADLRAKLTEMGVPAAGITEDRLRRARTLFARAIETPGGLKIQTIHAFCASLLRRFPLEAGVTPAFEEMDETAAARLHAEILDAMASGPDAPLVDGIARCLTESEPSAFLAQVAKHWPPGRQADDEATLRAALGIGADTEESVRDILCGAEMLDAIETFIAAGADAPGKTLSDLCASFRQIALADPPDRWDMLAALLLTKDGKPRATGRWPNAVKDGDFGPLVEQFAEMAECAQGARARLAALGSLDQSLALHAFAPAFARRLHAAKQARGWLDFDDQIARARHLLRTSDMAQWVLFKLDGGLDHILVDEAQDTAPDQWAVIEALAAEFGAGQGARPDVTRTLFVVGDRKQSIYRFQGADPDAFDRMRKVFADRLPAEAATLTDHQLLHSFRSAPAILRLVDRVFAEGGGVGDPPEHRAFKTDLPGRIDLWAPVAPDQETGEEPHWTDPVDRPVPAGSEVLLARRIARTVKAMIDEGTPIVEDGTRRPMNAGDVLILCQRRRRLFYTIIESLKAAGLDVAGADRLGLMDDMAVRDLIATLTFAALPDDDLSLAIVLRSPLGGLTERELYALAHGRGDTTLWQRARESRHDTAWLSDLIGAADRLRPYEVLQRILIRHDGRRRLLARLGSERAEAIDALLEKALAYETLETPSLHGFLGWLASAEPELKRQAGQGAIRVMSVHGAKGLEAPVVILPETGPREPRQSPGLLTLEGGIPVWPPAKAAWSPAIAEAVDVRLAGDEAERDRLLYVALTRAESRLIVATAMGANQVKAREKGATDDEIFAGSWWGKVKAAMDALGAMPGGEGGLTLADGDWTPLPAKAATDEAPGTARLPGWTAAPVPRPAAGAKPLSPSALPGAKALPGEGTGPTDVATARGTAIHALLEHLPALDPADRRPAAARIAPDAAPDAVDEALAVLDDAALTHLFAPDALAELPFALPAAAGRPAVAGTMDRVLVTPGRITIVDYKTNALVPATPAQVPAGLLAQMGAYHAAAAAIWPGHEIETAILWTRTRALMPIPRKIVSAAWAALDPPAPVP